jgi:hypothetical protein
VVAWLYHPGNNCHLLPAVFTEHGRARWKGIRTRQPHLQCQLQELDEAFGIGMKEAKISDPTETTKQDMLEQ